MNAFLAEKRNYVSIFGIFQAKKERDYNKSEENENYFYFYHTIYFLRFDYQPEPPSIRTYYMRNFIRQNSLRRIPCDE